MRRSRAASGGNRPAQPIDLDAHLARWRRCRHRPGREAGRQRHLQRGIGKTSREKRTDRAGDTWHGKFSGAMPMLATMAQRLSRLQKLERTSPRLVSAYAWSCWGYSLTGLWLLYCLPSMPGTCQSTVIMPTRAFALTLVLQARRAGCAASPPAPMPFYIPLRAFSGWISPARVCRRDRAHTRTTRSPRSAGPSLVVTPLGRGSTAPSRGSTS